MKHFHGTYKKVCDKHDPDYYGKFKKVGRSVGQPSVLAPGDTEKRENLPHGDTNAHATAHAC